MNVLFLDQFGELGGAQRCLLDLLPAVVEAGWHAHLAAPADGELLQRAAELGAGTAAIRCGPYTSGRKTFADRMRFAVQMPQVSRQIGNLARAQAADLIYVNGPRLLPAAATVALNGPPLLFHAHLMLDGYVRRLAGWSLRRASASVIACSRFVGDPLRQFGPVRVVYNGVAVPSPSSTATLPARDPKDARPRIGLVGRISPEKGQIEFLRAARLLLHNLPRCQFVICGAPQSSNPEAARYASHVYELAKGLPVEFTGWKPDTRQVFASLDLLVVPSIGVEAAPRVILESFAAGVPVIAFSSGGIPELIEHNVTGFLVERRQPEALAQVIRYIMQDQPNRLREVATRAMQRARTDFTLDRYCNQILESMRAAAKGHVHSATS